MIDPGTVPAEAPKKFKRVEFFWQHAAKNLSELPGLQIIKDSKTSKVEVLKKTIKIYDRETNTTKIRTAYITDPKQIKQFKKRKSKKEVREAKRKGGPAKKKRPTSPSERNFDEESSISATAGDGNKLIIKIPQPPPAFAEAPRKDESAMTMKLESVEEEKNEPIKEEAEEENEEEEAAPKEPLTIKLNLGDIQQAAKNIDYVMPDILPKSKPSGSRKRMNNPEKQFNEILEDIADKCIVFDTTKIFHQPVRKKEAPDYSHKILNPMDLGTMKNKAKRWEYKDTESFRRDIELIRGNAEKYNGPAHFIAHQARNIENFALELLAKYDFLWGAEKAKQSKINRAEDKLKPLEERIQTEMAMGLL